MVPQLGVGYVRDSLPRLVRSRRVEHPRPASRTPEGHYGRCPVCREFVCVEFSSPGGDAPCPCCGQLLWQAELRWPFVCEDQGLPLRGRALYPPRPTLPRLVRSLVVRVARTLRARPRKSTPVEPARPSSSTMYDPWLDG